MMVRLVFAIVLALVIFSLLGPACVACVGTCILLGAQEVPPLDLDDAEVHQIVFD